MNKLSTAAVIAACGLLAACGVNPTSARTSLEAMGMTNVSIGSWAMWGCGSEDNFASKFTATGVNGNPVSGVACSGILKGITIRLD
jgi:hypothetical protein